MKLYNFELNSLDVLINLCSLTGARSVACTSAEFAVLEDLVKRQVEIYGYDVCHRINSKEQTLLIVLDDEGYATVHKQNSTHESLQLEFDLCSTQGDH